MLAQEKQLTFEKKGHQLTNINVWTPDSQWLVYDVRPHGASFTGKTIERVNINSGETEILYCAQADACVGVVTVSANEPVRYVFIHGPEHPDEQWHYDFHHRRGVVVDDKQRDLACNLDALDITPPYTAGALRGGSHVHVFSPDGSRLSFTYNDHVMHEKDIAWDLRNVGIALPYGPVYSAKKHPREYDGSHYCVLVSDTTAQPLAGSDQISRAYEEGWIGDHGYINAMGQRQRWALAFIGDTLSGSGEKLPEVFIVDLPDSAEDYKCPGQSPLAGTPERLPAPPAGIVQRRVTYTAQRRFPGVSQQPRHWLRSSPDGRCIAFLMKDDEGIVQLWGVSPSGGEPWQMSDAESDIQSAFSWHPDGVALAFVCDNSVMLLDIHSRQMHRLTSRTSVPPCADAVVFSPDGTKIAYMRDIENIRQIFVVSLP
jgi:hypothetical protein